MFQLRRLWKRNPVTQIQENKKRNPIEDLSDDMVIYIKCSKCHGTGSIDTGELLPEQYKQLGGVQELCKQCNGIGFINSKMRLIKK